MSEKLIALKIPEAQLQNVLASITTLAETIVGGLPPSYIDLIDAEVVATYAERFAGVRHEDAFPVEILVAYVFLKVLAASTLAPQDWVNAAQA